MFNLSTQEVVLSIEKTPVIVKNKIVYQEYENFFGNLVIEKIKNGIKELKMVKLESHENENRWRVDYGETIFKELHLFFANSKITSALENKFNTKLKFSSLDLWFDHFREEDELNELEPHTDHDSIKLAIQIYLGEEENVGTSLYANSGEIILYENSKKLKWDPDRKPIHTFKYNCNNGYALLNTEASWHGIHERVKKNTRKSLYVRYS